MKFLGDDNGTDKNKHRFYKLLQKLDRIIDRHIELSYMSELNFVKELLVQFKEE